MKIYIKYENNKIILNTNNYQSINSIIYEYLEKNNITDNVENYYINYNGICLDKDFSLEKYNIIDNTTIELFKKIKGGVNSTAETFSSKNKFFVFCVVIIVILPIFILPMGFMSLTSSLLENIISKSILSIGNYLVCVLGKKTLFSRIRIFLFILKYIFFILMIFVIITFPLILLCITLKGKSILDNPKNMCSPINVGHQAGMILTILYIILYLIFRGGNYILETIIYIFKKSYILNMILNPLFKFLLSIYNTLKYFPVYLIPFIGAGLAAYFTFLEITLVALEMILSSVTLLGCSKLTIKNPLKDLMSSKLFKKEDSCCCKQEDKDELKDLIKNKLNDLKNKNIKEEVERLNNEIKIFQNTDSFCAPDKIICCNPSNFTMIADVFFNILENPLLSKVFKSVGMFPSMVLFTEALYESVISSTESNNSLLEKSYNDRRLYLKHLLQDKVNEIPKDTRELIREFLNNGYKNESERNIDKDNSLIFEIKKKLDKNFSTDDNKINELKDKINTLESEMIDYAKEDGSSYTPGKSLFKNVLKSIYIDIFCNVVSTTKASGDIIHKMGDMKDIIDMLKAGSSSGVFISIFYFITVIILIISGLFGMF
jgi:hypothetical protein